MGDCVFVVFRVQFRQNDFSKYCLFPPPGQISGLDHPSCVVGGNCSLHAFNHEGEEVYWNVAGDNVTALKCANVDGTDYIYSGSEDYEIRILKGESLIKEFTETDIPHQFVPIAGNRFAYGLMNGTVGLYHNFQRAWRIKSKHKLDTIFCFCFFGTFCFIKFSRFFAIFSPQAHRPLRLRRGRGWGRGGGVWVGQRGGGGWELEFSILLISKF